MTPEEIMTTEGHGKSSIKTVIGIAASLGVSDEELLALMKKAKQRHCDGVEVRHATYLGVLKQWLRERRKGK